MKRKIKQAIQNAKRQIQKSFLKREQLMLVAADNQMMVCVDEMVSDNWGMIEEAGLNVHNYVGTINISMD